MSRVFTCPPIVISRNQSSCQNLVETTKNFSRSTEADVESKTLYPNGLKLERIKIDSKKALRFEKKELRKQKKETKREKSHKPSSRKANDNIHKQKYLSSKRVSDDESDQLEKSSLTEELAEPQNHPGYSSDGSHNSKKRKRDSSPPAIESLIKAASVSGNPLRIRLIFKKRKAEVPVLLQEEIVCSTSAAKPLSNQDVITSSVSCSNNTEPEKNQPSTSVAASLETERQKKHKPSKEDQYNALFDNWTPNSTCLPYDSSYNDEWLSGNKRQEMLKPTAAATIDEDTKMRTGGSSWSRAKFLPEVGIHSLPYTVLF